MLEKEHLHVGERRAGVPACWRKRTEAGDGYALSFAGRLVRLLSRSPEPVYLPRDSQMHSSPSRKANSLNWRGRACERQIEGN